MQVFRGEDLDVIVVGKNRKIVISFPVLGSLSLRCTSSRPWHIVSIEGPLVRELLLQFKVFGDKIPKENKSSKNRDRLNIFLLVDDIKVVCQQKNTIPFL